jgi:hypothetical protein
MSFYELVCLLMRICNPHVNIEGFLILLKMSFYELVFWIANPNNIQFRIANPE